MQKTYRFPPLVRRVNSLIKLFNRLVVCVKNDYILTVRGRKTGKVYSTPVTLIQEGERRWLVSPYGEVNWVRTARASGQVLLTQGGNSENVRVVELDPEQSAPVLKQYLNQVPIVKPYFDARPDSSLEAFEAEARWHPVFRIEPG